MGMEVEMQMASDRREMNSRASNATAIYLFAPNLQAKEWQFLFKKGLLKKKIWQISERFIVYIFATHAPRSTSCFFCPQKLYSLIGMTRVGDILHPMDSLNTPWIFILWPLQMLIYLECLQTCYLLISLSSRLRVTQSLKMFLFSLRIVPSCMSSSHCIPFITLSIFLYNSLSWL